MAVVNNGIINNYSIKPKNLTQYYNAARRGVMDYTQIGQFDQFETGYSFLQVLEVPKFMKILGDNNPEIQELTNSFKQMLEFEFRGFTGLPDISTGTFIITDGVNELQMINDVQRDTSVQISGQYFEKRGGLITKFQEYYLTGIKDPMTKAKTYHGLIKNGLLEPGLENEVFTMLYYVTDNTMLRLERAFLLTNCQLTKAETSMYDSEKGQISNKEMTIEFNCFPVSGYLVDKAARKMLEDITGVSVTLTDGKVPTYKVVESDESKIAVLDSADYKYGIMNSASVVGIDALTQAIDAKE